MKTTKQEIILGFAIFLASAVSSFAIPGLQLSLQCSNVVLSWPSVEGQTYIIQYRPTLSSGTPWQTLTLSWPADLGTNLTFFVHSNIVQHPNCGGSGGSFAATAVDGTESDSLAMVQDQAGPLAMPADGSGSALPVAIYPPGFDFSNFLILDPASSEWISGSEYSFGSLSTHGFDGLQPDDGASGDATTNNPPDMGFYEVVQNGVQLFGITINASLSGTVEIGVEVGTDVGRLDCVTLSINGQPVPGTADLGSPISPPLVFKLDTARLVNGDNQIQAQATWRSPGTGSGVNPFFTLASQPISVSVFNEISYPLWMDNFGQDGTGVGACDFIAASATSEVDWQLDIYDSKYQYVGSASDQTTNGAIEFDWSLVDGGGVTHTDPQYESVLTTFDPGTGAMIAQKVLPVKLLHADNWTQRGSWVTARLDLYPANVAFYDVWVNNTDFISQMAEAMTSQSEVLPAYPNRQPGELYVLSCLGTNSAQRATDWQLMKSSLTNAVVRNLYLYAHGSPDSMGDNKGDEIDASEVETNLNQNSGTNAHSFRFVFMDGCESDGTFWPKAFGIPTSTNLNISYFYKNRVRPCACVGWGTDISAGNFSTNSLGDIDAGNFNLGFCYFHSQFVYNWTGVFGSVPGTPLWNALDTAKNTVGVYPDVPWPIMTRGFPNLMWNDDNDTFW